MDSKYGGHMTFTGSVSEKVERLSIRRSLLWFRMTSSTRDVLVQWEEVEVHSRYYIQSITWPVLQSHESSLCNRGVRRSSKW